MTMIFIFVTTIICHHANNNGMTLVYVFLLILATLCVVIAQQQEPTVPTTELFTLHLSNEPRQKVKCYVTYHSRHEMALEFQIDQFEIYNKTLYDAQGFMLRAVYSSLKNQDYKSLNRVKKHDGDVIQLVIEDGLEMVELDKRKFTDAQHHNFDQRFAVLEKNVGAILRSQYAGINVASVEYGARYVEVGNMTDDTISDDQIVSWFDGVPVIQNALPVVSFNFTMDQEKKYATSAPQIIKLAKPYIINVVSLDTTVSWYSKKESADQYLIADNQNIVIDVETSLDGNSWVHAGQSIETVPARYHHQLHKKGNTFALQYRSDIMLNEDFEAKFIRVSAKRRIEEFVLAVTDFVSSQAWSGRTEALCGLCLSAPNFLYQGTNPPIGCSYYTTNTYSCPVSTYTHCQQQKPTDDLVNPLVPKEWKENRCINVRLPVTVSSISAMYLINKEEHVSGQ